MNNQILLTLKKKLEELSLYGQMDVEIKRNAIKEELQFYVLNFIYHHQGYNKWTMYGGSALRICYGLDRMSVDLDFEIVHSITEKFLEELKKEIELYFRDTYNVDSDFLTIKTTTGRGLLLKFNIGDDLQIKHPSSQVHVKIDLNHFIAPKIATEHRPINHDQFSFVIKTYNMSTLMTSKVAAIFLRGIRGVGEAVYEEKGRDIYDLLWYMNKKIVPDLDYLIAKGIDVKDPEMLFDKLTLQINKVSNENLKQDLIPLFTNQTYINNWLKNWMTSYLHLLGEYKINKITTLKELTIFQDFRSDNFSFMYWYKTKDNSLVSILYTISDYWISFRDGDIVIKSDKNIDNLIEFTSNGSSSREVSKEKLKQYATLFYNKTEDYLKKTNRIILGDTIVTKVIRMTADNLNQKEQIVLNKSALLSSKLDDLLK